MINIISMAKVINQIKNPQDDNWGKVISKITLDDKVSKEAFYGLEEFSHVTIVFYMHKVSDDKICSDARYPRNNRKYKKVGIFSQRGKNRVNKIAVTDCELISVEDGAITVKGLDAINGSLVLDIKPVFKQFTIDKSQINQPEWVDDIMSNYFNE